MNDRIEALKALATKEVWSENQYNGAPEFNGYELDVEKFAELIVRECMDCSTWVGKVNMNAIEPVHTAHAINQRIRQHFGVEE